MKKFIFCSKLVNRRSVAYTETRYRRMMVRYLVGLSWESIGYSLSSPKDSSPF